MMVIYFNPDTLRGYTDEAAFGVACYQFPSRESGDVRPLVGRHKGCAGTKEEARQWCDGDDTIDLIKIFKDYRV